MRYLDRENTDKPCSINELNRSDLIDYYYQTATIQPPHSEATPEHSLMQTKRNLTIDVAKGIGIIFVVLGHNSITLHSRGELYRIIFSFHMPLFFFLSGFFLKRFDNPRIFLTSKFDSLLKPYFIVLISLKIATLIKWPPPTSSEMLNLWTYITYILYGTGQKLFLSQLNFNWITLWFLPHLFLSSVITWAIIRTLKSKAYILVYAIASLTLGVNFLTQQELPWSLDITPITSAFLCAGYLSTPALKSFNFNLKNLTSALLIFFGLHIFFNETIDLNGRYYGSFLICTTQAISGIYIILALAAGLKRYKFTKLIFEYFGHRTLFILLFHWYFQAKTFDTLINLINNPYIASTLSFIAGLIFPVIAFEITVRTRLISNLLLPKSSQLTPKSHEQP